MPRCDCAGSTCQCLILAGEGVQITGSGNTNNPYVITSTATIAGSLLVQDTRTVDMSAVGAGTPTDPFILSATARIAMEDITNVTGAPAAVGDTLSWNGTAWVMAPPPVVPPGAVNVGAGLLGTGAVDNPVRAAVSGVWGTAPLDTYGTDSTVGREIYVDANGQLRSRPISPDETQVPWDNITGRPSAFPTSWDQVSGKPSAFPTQWGQVTGRPRILTGRAVNTSVANSITSTRVTFPTGYFTDTPSVSWEINSGYPNTVATSIFSLTTAGFTINVWSSNATERPIYWTAVQSPSGP